MRQTKRIEWPAGSGVFADYDDEERQVVRDLFRARDDELITDEEMRRDVGLIHDLKAILDARLVPYADAEHYDFDEPEQTVLYLPEPDSPFQIPARAMQLLFGPGERAA
jgi:hypothetical protein